MFDAIETRLIPLLEQLYAAMGYVGLVFLMAFENVFFFLPVPSEIVLPLAGWMVARAVTEPLTGTAWSYAAAVLAATVGSTIGALVLYTVSFFGGRPFLERYGSRLLIDAHDLEVTDRWFQRYGDLAVLFARVIPLGRSIISIPAGIARMPVRRFLLFTVLGTLPWNAALIAAGLALGENWGVVRDYLKPLETLIYVAVAVLVVLFLWRHLRRGRRR